MRDPTRAMEIGIGCMRLSTDADRDDDRSAEVLRAALAAGFTTFDTAHAYGRDEHDLGHNERLVARVCREHGARPRIITKCGMSREGGAWIPDGRAKRIASDVEGSREALGGLPIDLLLLHAPDPRVPLATSVRALTRALEEGHTRAIGLSNVTRKHLEEIVQIAPISSIQIALGAYDDAAVRGGLTSYCEERGIEVLAYSVLGGPKRYTKLARDPALLAIAETHSPASALDIFVAYLRQTRPHVAPILGARRPSSIAALARCRELVLSSDQVASLNQRFPGLAPRSHEQSHNESSATVVLMVGLPGAGKSRAALGLVDQGYERLNRDTTGGTLRVIADRLDARLAAGTTRFVLDNTYLTRATRNDVIRIARTHGASVKCMFFDTPVAEAQTNVVTRMLERFGRLLMPEEIGPLARKDTAAMAPNAVTRCARELEHPSADEGFDTIETIAFARAALPGRPACFVTLDALGGDADWPANLRALLATRPTDEACLVYGWREAISADTRAAFASTAAEIAAETDRTIELEVCGHPGGPPICWCRPPLPGLLLAFARRHGIELARATLTGASTADRTLARNLGLRFTAAQ